jgi:hypothetical protein
MTSIASSRCWIGWSTAARPAIVREHDLEVIARTHRIGSSTFGPGLRP